MILISHLGTQDLIIILLRQASLLDYVYLCKLRHCFYLLVSLAKAISGRAEIVGWKLDTDMMMCKKSSDAHLFSHDIIDFHGKQCILLVSSYMHDVIWQLCHRFAYFVVV